MKKIFGILSALSFLAVISTAGGMDQNQITTAQGFFLMAIGLVGAVLFFRLTCRWEHSSKKHHTQQRMEHSRHPNCRHVITPILPKIGVVKLDKEQLIWCEVTGENADA